MNTINFFAAFTAGVVSFLSPCILPLLPGYLSFLTGHSLEQASGVKKPTAIAGATAFGLGFTIVFIAMGATATALGRFLFQNQWIFSKILGVIVLIFGLHMLGIFKINSLYKEKKFHTNIRSNKSRYLKAFILGLAFAFGWTPCIGPVLSGILALAAQQTSISSGIALLTAYSLGLWLPFMLAALFTVPVFGFMSKHPNISKYAQIVAGVLLICMGIIMISGKMTKIISILS